MPHRVAKLNSSGGNIDKSTSVAVAPPPPHSHGFTWAPSPPLSPCRMQELVQVETLAQLGVQLLLFGLGLELSMSKIRAVWGVAILGAPPPRMLCVQALAGMAAPLSCAPDTGASPADAGSGSRHGHVLICMDPYSGCTVVHLHTQRCTQLDSCTGAMNTSLPHWQPVVLSLRWCLLSAVCG